MTDRARSRSLTASSIFIDRAFALVAHAQHEHDVRRVDETDDAFAAIGLWRAKEPDRFSEEERRVGCAVLPHLLEAGSINRELWLDRVAHAVDGRGNVRAIVNRAGVLASVVGGMFFVLARGKSRVESLSPSQFAIARRIAAGLSYKQVARELDLSPLSVRNQLHNIYTKLDVQNRAALAQQFNELK